MTAKSQKTANFIIRTTAPIFNKKGYTGTSLSEITSATGLTKGAIYGNFINKENLAIEAFNYNVRQILDEIKKSTDKFDSSIEKLFALTDFYRNYYKLTIDFGGCPILNIGVDANHLNPKLFERVQDVIQKLHYGIKKIILLGIDGGEIKPNIDVNMYADLIFSSIEGSIFMSVTMKDGKYINNMMDHLDLMIISELKLF